MARNIRLTPYDEQMIDAFDQDASGPQYAAYGSSAPSTPTESYLPSDDTMPLFLSDDAEEPRRRGFGAGGGGNRERPSAWPRVLKVGIFTASAAAIAFAFVSVENPLALFANAKASLNGTSPGQAAAPVKAASEPAAPVRLASAEPAATAIQTTAGARTSLPTAPPAATSMPTRDEIAAALRNAHQGRPEIRQPPAVAVAPVVAALPVAASPAAASPPAPVAQDMIPTVAIHRLDPNEIALSLTRANALIASGDLAAARLVLRRAADSGDARSAMTLAETYDPAILAKLSIHGVAPDLVLARGWYEKAKQFGAAEATQRLELLASKEH